MVDILAIASGWSTVTVRFNEIGQSSLLIFAVTKTPPCRVSCWAVVRDIARAHCCNEREYPHLRLASTVIPLLTNHPPRALNINRSAAERSATRGASRSRRHISRRQPTTNPCGISHVDDHSEERSVVRERRHLPSSSPGSDSSR